MSYGHRRWVAREMDAGVELGEVNEYGRIAGERTPGKRSLIPGIVQRGRASAGDPLPASLREKFEHSLGAPLDGVRVHTGASAADSARALGARAYTVGQDIFFSSGRFDPHSPDGEALVAHEVAHTVQQAGSPGDAQFELEVSQPGDPLEREAHAAAASMLRGERVSGLGRGAGVQRDPETSGPDAPGPASPAATREDLESAVQRARDLAQLQQALRAIQAIRSSDPARIYGVPIAGTSYGVRGADLQWLHDRIDVRSRQIMATERGLVDRRIDPDAPPRAPAPASTPAPSGGASATPAPSSTPARQGEAATAAGRPTEFRTTAQFPWQSNLRTPVGTFTFEYGVEVQGRVARSGDEREQPVTIEATGRAGQGGTGQGGINTGQGGSGAGQGGGLTVTGAGLAEIEERLHRHFDAPARDRLRVERRNGSWQGVIGLDFGTASLGIGDIGFRFNLASLRQGEAPRFFSLELPINSNWIDLSPNARWRFAGKITFQPDYAAVARALANLLARSGVVVEAGVEIGAALARAAAQVAMEAPLLALEAAAAVAGVAAPFVLAGAVAASIIAFALMGFFILASIAEPQRPVGRRREDDDIDPSLTRLGNDLHHRVRAFCAAYALTMRGQAYPAGPGAEAGARAARERMVELQQQGHTAADVLAAARSADDLEQRVLAAARAGFQDRVEWIVERDMTRSAGQQREWATRHLRSSIHLGATNRPATRFRFDECREPIPVDPLWGPSDRPGCDTGGGASDADAPLPPPLMSGPTQ